MRARPSIANRFHRPSQRSWDHHVSAPAEASHIDTAAACVGAAMNQSHPCVNTRRTKAATPTVTAATLPEVTKRSVIPVGVEAVSSTPGFDVSRSQPSAVSPMQ